MKSLSSSLPFSLSAALLLVATGCQVKPASNSFAKGTTTTNKPAAATATASAPVLPAAAPSRPGPGSGRMTTASGLQYEVLAAGPGTANSPTRNDSVTVHYRGMLKSGTVFDSSYDRGAPTTFGVSQVIPGWTEALQLMKPGDKWMLYIPFNLAYGAQGMQPKIPPFSDLVFQVELLQVGSGL